jgi:hypothetical protein
MTCYVSCIRARFCDLMLCTLLCTAASCAPTVTPILLQHCIFNSHKCNHGQEYDEIIVLSRIWSKLLSSLCLEDTPIVIVSQLLIQPYSIPSFSFRHSFSSMLTISAHDDTFTASSTLIIHDTSHSDHFILLIYASISTHFSTAYALYLPAFFLFLHSFASMRSRYGLIIIFSHALTFTRMHS